MIDKKQSIIEYAKKYIESNFEIDKVISAYLFGSLSRTDIDGFPEPLNDVDILVLLHGDDSKDIRYVHDDIIYDFMIRHTKWLEHNRGTIFYRDLFNTGECLLGNELNLEKPLPVSLKDATNLYFTKLWAYYGWSHPMYSELKDQQLLKYRLAICDLYCIRKGIYSSYKSEKQHILNTTDSLDVSDTIGLLDEFEKEFRLFIKDNFNWSLNTFFLNLYLLSFCCAGVLRFKKKYIIHLAELICVKLIYRNNCTSKLCKKWLNSVIEVRKKYG